MGRLVEIPTADGGSVMVEVEVENEPTGGPRRGWGTARQAPERADWVFEEGIVRARPAVEAVLNGMRSLPDIPNEVAVEFGLAISAEAGAFIASASTAANFKVTLTWRRPDPEPA